MASTTCFSSRRPDRRRGFTLIEAVVATSLFVTLFVIVMLVVVGQGKLGIALGNYGDMNSSGRVMLTQFEKDVRMAKTVTYNGDGATEFMITPANAVNWDNLANSTGNAISALNSANIRYFYSATDKKLYRQYPATSLGAGVDANCAAVLSNLSTCKFLYFNSDDAVPQTTTSVDKVIFSGVMNRTLTGITNSEYTVSAAVIMRGKAGTKL